MLIIIGTGAVAAELTFFTHGYFELKGYIEYPGNIEKYYRKYKYEAPALGDIDSYNIEYNDFFMLGFANLQFRKVMIEKVKAKGGRFINFIHPSSIVSPDLVMGEGNVISPFCLIDPNVRLGNFNLMTGQTAISHDCTLGDNNFLSTSVLCGEVTVGDDNFFGVRSAVIPHMKIGNGNTIQAGMIVSKDIEDDATVFHQFKEKIICYK